MASPSGGRSRIARRRPSISSRRDASPAASGARASASANSSGIGPGAAIRRRCQSRTQFTRMRNTHVVAEACPLKCSQPPRARRTACWARSDASSSEPVIRSAVRNSRGYQLATCSSVGLTTRFCLTRSCSRLPSASYIRRLPNAIIWFFRESPGLWDRTKDLRWPSLRGGMDPGKRGFLRRADRGVRGPQPAHAFPG